MSLNVLLYPSNLINYLRLLLLFLMFFNIKRCPLFAFIFNIIGGSIDLIDGPIARQNLLTSKFGQFLDILMDRLTIIILFIYLSRIYSKYWHVFCFLALIEFARDLSSTIANFNLNLLDFLNTLESIPSNELAFKMKMDIYNLVGLKTDKLINDNKIPIKHEISNLQQEVPEVKSSFNNFLKEAFLNITPATWYLSDLFYWILYCGAYATLYIHNQHNSDHLVDLNNNSIFINNSSNKDKFELTIQVDDYNIKILPLQQRNELDVLRSNNCKIFSIKSIFSRTFREIKNSFPFVIIISDSLGTALNDFVIKVILDKINLKFLQNFLNLKFIFRIFGLICYFFTIYRSYLNICTIFSNRGHILIIDYEHRKINGLT
jgi:hypothetical protein